MTSFDLDLSKYNLGWSDADVEYAFKPEKGLNEGVIDQISWWKGEPRWMAEMRRRSLRTFDKKPMAEWFAINMPDIDFQDIYYYLRPANEQVSEWDDLPEQMKATYEKLGIPEAERKYLAGVTAQYECLRGSTKVWTTRGMRTDQGTRRRRRSVRAERGDQADRSRTCTGWRCVWREGNLRDPRRQPHDRRVGQPPIPRAARCSSRGQS